MTQVRNDPFPPKVASDEDLSKPDGSFCIRFISPGTYLLSAEKSDYDKDRRWIGYYPDAKHFSEAKQLEVEVGTNLSGLTFTVEVQPLYTVSFRIETADGRQPDLGKFAVSIRSADKDPLGYQITQYRTHDGYYTVGYVPPGRYVVQTLIQPILMLQNPPPEFEAWKMAEQEVEIKGDTRIVLRLIPKN